MPEDSFKIRWRALTELQQRFLLAAYDLNQQLPHSDGWSKLFPTMKWRTIGAMCGMSAGESDEIARILAERNWISVINADQRLMILLDRIEIGEWVEKRRSRWWQLAAGVVMAVVLLLTRPKG